MPEPSPALPLTILNYLLAGGAFFTLSVGVGELFAPRKKPIAYVTSALAISFGVAVLIYLAQTLGLYRQWPWSLYLYYPLELFAGTLMFFFFTLLVEDDFPLLSPYLLLFVPVVVATGLMMVYFLQEPAVKLAQMPLYHTDDRFFAAVYRFIAHNLETWVLFNIVLFVVRTRVRLRNKKVVWKPRHGSILVFAGLFFLALLLGVWVNFFPSEVARKGAIFLAIVLVYPLYFFQQRNPEIFGLLAGEKDQWKYQNSTKLAGMDTTKTIQKLDRLMTQDQRYLDSELTLAQLASEVGLSPHQLSEVLNAKLGTNFRQYINRFRVEAAMACFTDTPDQTILEVAFACGFGSKSAFQAAFSQVTGKTPTNWIKERTEL